MTPVPKNRVQGLIYPMALNHWLGRTICDYRGTGHT
jgi:hypothetical protein